MKKLQSTLLLIMLAFTAFASTLTDASSQDTNEVKKLNKQAYDSRLTSPDQTVAYATKALNLSNKLNYTYGKAEAFRMMGLGQYYMNRPEAAISSYLQAQAKFDSIGNLRGLAKVDNNIGTLYRDADYDRSLVYFQNALKIGEKLNDKQLIASSSLNLGNYYSRKKSFTMALKYYEQSQSLYASLKDSVNVVQCLQNRGVTYYNLHELDMAQDLLTQANQRAKELDLNEPVASINLTLASVYIAKNDFDNARKVVEEGIVYAQILKDDKLIHDFKYTNYQLEYKRKNYKSALTYLSDVYRQDSIDDKANIRSGLNLFEMKSKQEKEQREIALNKVRSQIVQIEMWGAAILAGLLIVVVALLLNNVKRKNKTNQQLTELNAEVLKQKENVDRVNHHLEEIIDERTKDLQVKNKKLSDYSSYLSHQIRGPIATLKGLLNLEKEGLVDQKECIDMMGKCVTDIDEKIIEMSDMMHDSKLRG